MRTRQSGIGSGYEQQAALFPQRPGTRQIGDQPVGQGFVVITEIAGIYVLHEGESGKELGQGVTRQLPLFEHEEGEHYLQCVTRQTVDALFECGETTEGAFQCRIDLTEG